jgi:hypothetical protein
MAFGDRVIGLSGDSPIFLNFHRLRKRSAMPDESWQQEDEGTSFNDLIRTIGMTKGALYFHFRSKEELAFAAFDSMRSRMVAASGS